MGFNSRLVLSWSVLSLLATGCVFGENKQFFDATATNASVASSPTPIPGVTTQTAVTFKTLKPALAVRGASCLMCHAQVNANVISDFGYGSTYFFDHDTPTTFDGTGSAGGIYSDWFEGSSSGSLVNGTSAYGSAIIQGSLIVPKVSLDHTYPLLSKLDPNSTKSSISLAAAIQMPRVNAAGAVLQPAMSVGISPASGTTAVIEKSKIYIGAPTEAEILAMAPNLTQTGFASVAVNGINPVANLPLSGLTVVNGSAGSYVTNSATAPLVCAGDVMIRGVLFLKSPVIKTDNNGCRLYVSGGVFMQGAVTYTGTNLTTANLQITSAKIIAMGFSLATLSDRLSLSGSRAWVLPRYKSRFGTDPQTLQQSLYSQAAAVGALMVDADAGTTNLNPMTGVLLNAPEVHSRYIGNFNGAVVAEIALFRLSEFSFTFDSIFQTVPIFPALKSDILSITD